jgi:hypothetical protein
MNGKKKRKKWFLKNNTTNIIHVILYYNIYMYYEVHISIAYLIYILVEIWKCLIAEYLELIDINDFIKLSSILALSNL